MSARRTTEVVEARPVENRASGVVYFVVSLIQVILLFRLILRLFGASEQAGFVQFIYDISSPLVAPFFGIFQTSFDLTQGVLEVETLVAMVVYAVAGYLLIALIELLRSR